MFSDTSHSIQFGHEFVLIQRTREIAGKGFSTIAIPKPGKKPPAAKIDPAITKIHDALFHQGEYLSALGARIHHTVRLMECLYEKNEKMAIATMQKVKIIQHEYVHVLRIIAAMKAYKKHIKLGLMNSKGVEKMLKEIEMVPWNKKPSNAGKNAMVIMIEKQQYFPVMSTGGKISFSSNMPPVVDTEATCSSENFSASSRTSVSSHSRTRMSF